MAKNNESPAPAGQPPDDFTDLYKQFHRLLLCRAFAELRDWEAAADLVQESFLRLWREQQDGGDIGHPLGWLCRVADRLVIDYQRNAFYRRRRSGTEVLECTESRELSPPDTAARRELAEAVRNELKELSDIDQLLIRMRFFFDMTLQQIGEETGLRTATIHARLARILLGLKRWLEPRWTDDAESEDPPAS